MSRHLRPRISLTRSPKHIATMHIVRKGSGMYSSTFLNSSTESAFGSRCLFELSFTRTRVMGLTWYGISSQRIAAGEKNAHQVFEMGLALRRQVELLDPILHKQRLDLLDGI